MSASENGWQPGWVGQDQLEWTQIPGTTVNLQIRKGQPLKIMRAFAADFNAYIEPLRDKDSACYTPTNSVSTSNHLNGTAMDLNWGGMGDYGHPFHVKGTFNATQMKTIRELLAFYEDTIFWAGDWQSPIDEMHWQMGYGSYGNPNTDSFIVRKIRSDGFSTFRRGPIQAQTKDDVSPTTGVDVASIPQQQWDEVYRQLTQRLNSRSIYRTPGEGAVDTGFGMVLNIDAMSHADLIDRLAKLGDPDAVARVARTAAGMGAVTDQWAIDHAKVVLADIEKNNPAALQQLLKKV